MFLFLGPCRPGLWRPGLCDAELPAVSKEGGQSGAWIWGAHGDQGETRYSCVTDSSGFVARFLSSGRGILVWWRPGLCGAELPEGPNAMVGDAGLHAWRSHEEDAGPLRK